MPPALQTITFAKLNITGSAFEAVSPISGDSATFFNVPMNSEQHVAEIWGSMSGHAAEASITATRWHDQTYGIRAEITSGATTAPINRAVCLSSIGIDQPIYPSDVLTVQINGTANDECVITLLVYYRDLPGIKARLATYEWVKQHTKNQVGINATLTSGTAVPGTAVALNAADSRLHANTDYALLGFTSTLTCASVTVQGIDTGNMRVGGPVLGDPGHDGTLFVDYARAYNAPLIPIINSQNAGNTLLQGTHVVGQSTPLDVNLAELDTAFVG